MVSEYACGQKKRGKRLVGGGKTIWLKIVGRPTFIRQSDTRIIVEDCAATHLGGRVHGHGSRLGGRGPGALEGGGGGRLRMAAEDVQNGPRRWDRKSERPLLGVFFRERKVLWEKACCGVPFWSGAISFCPPGPLILVYRKLLHF